MFDPSYEVESIRGPERGIYLRGCCGDQKILDIGTSRWDGYEDSIMDIQFDGTLVYVQIAQYPSGELTVAFNLDTNSNIAERIDG